MMRAAIYRQKGTASNVLEVVDLPMPTPAVGEVRVQLHTSGVNPSDVKMRSGLTAHAVAMPYPMVIPHSDGAGIIDAVGSRDDDNLVGKRVYVYNAGWQRAFGTAAEYVTLPREQAVPLPNHISFAHGACLGIPAMTAYHALTRAHHLFDSTILVSGGGNVGRYCIQIAKALGAKTVICTVGNDNSEQVARCAGADHVINYNSDNLATTILELSGGGIDHAVDCEFGHNAAMLAAVLKVNASVAAYGSARIAQPTFPFYDFMFKDITLYMPLVYRLTSTCRQAAILGLHELLEQEKITDNIAVRLPLTAIATAHDTVETGQQHGAVILDIV